jgi:xylulokinase
MTQLTIGIDIGTTGTKAILLDAAAGVIASASRPSALSSPHTGFAEASLEQWLANIRETVAELMETSGVSASDVLGVATSGMVPAVVLLDKSGNPLRPAILQNDARAVKEIDEIAQSLRDVNFVSDTGSALSQQSVAPTLVWLAKNEPEIWEQTHHIVGSYDWALMALGAEAHVEQNWALESGLFYIDGTPHQRIRECAGLEALQIPSVARSGTAVGQLESDQAALMGLNPGTALFVGGADHVLSAYGAGVSNEGDWLIKLGGAGDILVKSETPLVDERLYLDAHPIPGGWLPNGCMATSGSLIRWFQELTGASDLVAMDEKAAKAEPSSVLCLPYFLGEKSPLHDTDLRGGFFGMHLGTTTADMYRSVLEAIAFGFRHHRDVFIDCGITLSKAMVTNGGSKSVLWKQIHADVLGVDLHPVVNHPGASLGAAVIAGVGAGCIDGLANVSDYVTLGETVTPDPINQAKYDQAYEEWRELADITTPLAHRLSERTRS